MIECENWHLHAHIKAQLNDFELYHEYFTYIFVLVPLTNEKHEMCIFWMHLGLFWLICAKKEKEPSGSNR